MSVPNTFNAGTLISAAQVNENFSYLFSNPWGFTSNDGTVTSADASGGTTGLTFSGGPITASGTLTLGGTLAVANGGTGTGTAFTAGSIVFAGSAGVYTQDNSKLFWDDTNKRLGVGTAAPAYLIDLYDTTNATFGISSDAAAALQVQRSQTAVNGGNFNFRKTRGTVASPTAVASGDQIGAIRCLAYGGTNYRAIATIEGYVETYTSNSDISSYLSFATCPAGSITATERVRIDSAGNFGIGESAPDYKLDVNGTIGFAPGASVTPVDNGDVVFELTNNTTLTIKAKGSDGVVRSGTITLA